MHAKLTAIEYHLPETILSNQDLSREFPEWQADKIENKIGISKRHIAGPDECASDLAVAAAHKLFDSGVCRPEEIDFVLLCTETADYFLPATACLVQHRLRIPTAAGALDFNLGCSGFVYGLGLAEGLIVSEQAQRVLLLTVDTFSKFIHPRDKGVRALFGDAAAATLLVASPHPSLGPFIYGTDGAGALNLIVPSGGMREPRTLETAAVTEDQNGNMRSRQNLFMSGGDIFDFALAAVPESVDELLKRARLSFEQIDLFVFHQANRFMLEHLRRSMKIPMGKFQIAMAHSGNTVSSTIPIALHQALAEGRLKEGSTVMLVGFGVGYSWGATLLRW
jgi:3-oxoacyl-[acyl-carrier-protein] synthase III